MTTMPLPFQLVEPLRRDVDLTPSRAHDDDAGLDVRAAHDVTVAPGERRLVATGVKFAVPLGTVLDVRPRSGLAHKYGVSVVNAPGTVDAGYRGEVKVNLINHGEHTVTFVAGERIAQVVLLPVIHAVPLQVEHLGGATARGEHGHGSSGVR